MGLSHHILDLARFTDEPAVAVGVSGGPDSLALAWLLKDWAREHAVSLHILTVDHGLRAESGAEAVMVASLVAHWPQVTHGLLRWEGEKPGSRLLEEARRARYRLMGDYCQAHSIRHLFLAHHQDDQAETFLLRLAKGSGLDGLAAMQSSQALDGLTLVRPLLAIAKEELVALCEENALPYIRDPSNENPAYTRPRLRAARQALEEEGLSGKRLATTALRLGRARAALEEIAQREFTRLQKQEAERGLAFDARGLAEAPEEIMLRIVLMAMDRMRAGDHDYPPRLEKVEKLVRDLRQGQVTARTTLGGCLFVPDAKNGVLWVETEDA